MATNRVHCSEFIGVATNSTHVLPIYSSGVATNSTCVTHEVLAEAVSKQLVFYYLPREKMKKTNSIFIFFCPFQRGFCFLFSVYLLMKPTVKSVLKKLSPRDLDKQKAVKYTCKPTLVKTVPVLTLLALLTTVHV